MNINTAFPSKYLKADVDVTDDLLVTISHVKMETVGQGAKAELKPVAYFNEVIKGLVLNKTNAKMIGKIAKADDTDEWKGVRIRLISTEVEYQGDIVMGIRVREVKKAAKPAPSDETPDAPNQDQDDPLPF